MGVYNKALKQLTVLQVWYDQMMQGCKIWHACVHRGPPTGANSAEGRRRDRANVNSSIFILMLGQILIPSQEGLGIGEWDEGSRYVGQCDAQLCLKIGPTGP